MCQDYYVYVHYKKSNGEPFYVGKGIKNRDATSAGRNQFWHNVVNKYDYIVERVANNLTEPEALKFEQMLIASLGRRDLNKGPLVNLTDGGEGTSNPSQETRQKRIKALIGNTHSLGRVMPEWEKELRSKSSLGHKKTKQGRDNIGKAKLGNKNPNFNPTVFIFQHNDGRVFEGTQHELKTLMLSEGIPHTRVKAVSGVANKTRRSVAGWSLKNSL